MGNRRGNDRVIIDRGERVLAMAIVCHRHRKGEQHPVERCVDIFSWDLPGGDVDDGVLQIG